MSRSALSIAIGFLLLAGSAPGVGAVGKSKQSISPIKTESGLVGDVDGTEAVPSKALQDTVWIADWTFDSGAACTSTGWGRHDLRILNNGTNYWVVNNSFADSFGISGNAVMLRGHNICWSRDGYPNDADYSIILKYRGPATISFRYLSDTEPTYDYVIVEADSAGASETSCASGTSTAFSPSTPTSTSSIRQRRYRATSANWKAKYCDPQKLTRRPRTAASSTAGC